MTNTEAVAAINTAKCQRSLVTVPVSLAMASGTVLELNVFEASITSNTVTGFTSSMVLEVVSLDDVTALTIDGSEYTTDTIEPCKFECGALADDTFKIGYNSITVRACFECADERGLTEFN